MPAARPEEPVKPVEPAEPLEPVEPVEPVVETPARVDLHPIAHLMEEADRAFREYEGGVSTTFKQTVEKYRDKYGRHPPPRLQGLVPIRSQQECLQHRRL